MRESALLVADDVRDRLHAAVTPFVDAVVDRLDAPAQALARGRAEYEHPRDGRRYRCQLGALVQRHPLLLRVVLRGLPNAIELERFAGEEVAGLEEAVDAIIAGALAGLPRGDADLVITAAEREGELLVSFDLESGAVKVMVARRGEDLSGAVVVGAIVSEPVTAH